MHFMMQALTVEPAFQNRLLGPDYSPGGSLGRGARALEGRRSLALLFSDDFDDLVRGIAEPLLLD